MMISPGYTTKSCNTTFESQGSAVSNQVDMRIPKCWVNRFDHETYAFLLLEYLGHAEKGDILKGAKSRLWRNL